MLGLKEYHPIVRPAVLTGFLGYVFVVIGLLADLGRPWKLPVPMVYSYGTGSVMFEVGWCVALYLTVLALEFSPVAFEWLGLKKAREWAIRLTLGLTILGLCLSTLHQSSLGALFLMMPHRVHPLWYSGFVPIFFFVSAIIAGLSMVIVESAISHRVFKSQIKAHDHGQTRPADARPRQGRGGGAVRLLLPEDAGPGGRRAVRPAADALRLLVHVRDARLHPRAVVPLRASPCGARTRVMARWVAGWVVLGIVVNRLNLSVIAFNYNAPERYIPGFMEIMISVTIITIGILTFRWIVNRMPVLYEHPDFPQAH